MIGRRKLLIALGAVALEARVTAFAQQTPKVWRIGVLNTDASPSLDGFYQGLREHGYFEGKNIVIERRFTGNDAGNTRQFAQELVALKVDVILAPSSTFVEAARQATSEIPIVFSQHNDPLGNGHIASLARPGGNITGVSQMATDLNAKHLQLLKELLPGATRVAVLSNPTTPSHGPALKEIERAGRKLELKVHVLEASTFPQLELAFTAATSAGDQGLLLLSSPFWTTVHRHIAAVAIERGLPVMFTRRDYVDVGGLISYGPNIPELNRRAAAYVDRILKGANPATMAIEQPTKFEIVINLKTAKMLRVTVPRSMLLRADEVIH